MTDGPFDYESHDDLRRRGSRRAAKKARPPRRASPARSRGRHAATRAAAAPSAVAGTAGGPPVVRQVGKRRRTRRSFGERAVMWAVIIVATVLVASGSVYGYLWYRLGQIKSEKCPACAVETAGAPYNVLIVGSDTRAGDTGGAAQAFGSASQVGGQRSDTIKILHVDPQGGTARLLSIPRDTYVALSGMSSSSGLATDNKINTAFNDGPTPLIETIQNTFGIPIHHFVVIDFNGVINLVNSVGGINLDFRYPVRDNDNGNNNSGLRITRSGCQTLNGNMALALARSRYYQYEVRPGVWEYDPTSDLGRIQRQNIVIESVINKAKSNYNPIAINSFLGSVVHDITKDDGLSSGGLISLAQRYHAFSGSALKTYTLPTTTASNAAGSVQIVQQPQANDMLTQFLGGSPGTVTTPPLDAGGAPVTVPPTTTQGSSGNSGSTQSPGNSVTTTTAPQPGTGPFNPTPC